MNRKFLCGFAFMSVLVISFASMPVVADSAPKNNKEFFKKSRVAKSTLNSYRVGVSSSALKSLSKYMVKLINKDRKKNGVSKVKLDTVASKAGQKHSDDMAKGGYLSHWDKKGQKPDQRYTNVGGRDYVAENVYMHCEFSGNISASKSTVKAAEKAFMNSAGHRANILLGNHTHVGIGIAVKNGCILISQEFVDRFGKYGKIPKKAKVGKEITITGTLKKNVDFDFIGIYWEKKPKKMTKKKLKKTGPYYAPEDFSSPTKYSASSGVTIIDRDFSLTAPVGDYGPGLYYIAIRVTKGGKDILASQRTILVK